MNLIHYHKLLRMLWKISVPQGPPNNVTGSPTGTNSIKLSWLPVSKELQKGIIRGYQVKIYDEEGEYLRNSTILSRNLSASFAGLYQYSNYSLKVRAFTRKGFGPWSSLINVSIDDPGKHQLQLFPKKGKKIMKKGKIFWRLSINIFRSITASEKSILHEINIATWVLHKRIELGRDILIVSQ